MMSKDEIINKAIKDMPVQDMRSQMTDKEWFGWFEEVMDYHAQNEAIAFANWLQYQEMDGRSTEKLYKDFKDEIG